MKQFFVFLAWCVAIMVTVYIAFYYLPNRQRECEALGGTLVRGTVHYVCAKELKP